jgi:hypothetical protein
MGIDPSTGTITARYGATTGASLGGAEVKFVQGSADSLTLMTKADNTNDFHALYATGLTVKQYMAEGQQPATYIINMTLTIA